jgi:uncharacterized GH25 family protein
MARALATLLAAVLALPALAHDFWVEPSSYEPAVGEILPVSLFAGHLGAATDLPREGARLRRFVARSASGETSVAGWDGSTPAGLLKPREPGLVAIACEEEPAPVETDAAAFEAYLLDEGQDAVVVARAERGESSTAGRERLTRSAKALVAVGGNAQGPYDAAFALPLEIVAEANPYVLRPGEAFQVRVLRAGAAEAGARVVAFPRERPDARVEATADAEGRARLVLPTPGAWVVKCVHVARAEGEADVQWRTLWTSLSFRLREERP